jgi:cytochrome c biogenesis protein ResB
VYFAAAEDAAVLPEAALQAASALAVMPLMAAAEASFRKLLREIFSSWWFLSFFSFFSMCRAVCPFRLLILSQYLALEKYCFLLIIRSKSYKQFF